jgi:cytochrome c553
MALDGEATSSRADHAFKAGDRKNEMTSIIIEELSPTDSEDLAAYYSAIEIPARKAPSP